MHERKNWEGMGGAQGPARASWFLAIAGQSRPGLASLIYNRSYFDDNPHNCK